jgi:hypothetical protein
MERCYWDYWRLLVPVGSELVNGPANAVPAEQLLTKIPDFAPVHSQPGDGGTVEFSGIFVLPPRSDQELLLSYALPASILNPSTDGALRYRLRIQKQPGTGALPVKLVVLYPPDWIISRPLFAANLSTGLVQADLTLQTDLELEVAFRTR